MSAELPVSVWNDWKIVEKIGEGSFGKVYKAEQVKDGKTYYSAIKVISIPGNQSEVDSVRAELKDDEAVRAYFRALVDDCTEEVLMMIRLHGDSNIVSVEDCKVVDYLDEIGWDIFIRMEYLTSFTEYYSENPIVEEDVIRLGIDISKALENCKKRNVIHRDIKAENIFRNEKGEFKLGDFGIARQMERTMSALSKKGTFSYMAPEMYRGEQYDHRADLYSLGIVLYKLRNRNRLPFINLNKQLITYRDKENALTRRMSGEKLAMPVEASEELAEIILKACEFKVEDRYASASGMRRDLEALLEKKYPELYWKIQREDGTNVQKPDIKIEISENGKKKETGEKKENTNLADAESKSTEVLKEAPEKKPKKRASKGLIIFTVAVWEAVIVALLILIRMGVFSGEKPDSLQDKIAAIENERREIEAFVHEDSGYVEQPGEHRWNRDVNDQKVKIYVYPEYSDDSIHEEYYYWDGNCTYARTWTDNNDFDQYYYDEEGTLLRWIDADGTYHDQETENREFQDRGKYYWLKALEEMGKMQNGISD